MNNAIHIIFQIVFTIIGVVVSLVLGGVVSAWLAGIIMQQIERLRRDHAELAKEVRKRTPFFAATIVLVAEAYKIIADKCFEDDAGLSVVVSVGVLVLFWIAQQLALDEEKKWKRICGLVSWFATILIVPVLVMLVGGWGIKDLIEEINNHLDSGTKVSLAVVTIVLILIPFTFKNARE